MSKEAPDEDAVETRAGKYLTFFLGDTEYAFEILKVREIIGLVKLTTLPQVPPYVLGVVNLRGKLIPVLDLRTMLGMPPREHGKETRIIVVQVAAIEAGIVVDNVVEVLDIKEEGVDDTPDLGSDVDTEFVIGVSKAAERVTVLMDIGKILNVQEVAAAGAAARA